VSRKGGSTPPLRVSKASEGCPVRRRRFRATMTQTKVTIAVLVVGFTIAALIVLSALSVGAVAGA